ncbi:MAG TPA: hypothetical protein VNP72_00445 [Longimicrobium sp.]|nr:hypothetical protein [Longimicrobium sp.]
MKLARFVLAAACLTTLAACGGSPTSADFRAGRPQADEIVAPLPTDDVVGAVEDGAGLADDATPTPCRGELVTTTNENGTTTTVCRSTQLGSGA